MIELIADITDEGKRVRVPLNISDAADPRFKELLDALITQAMHLIQHGDLITASDASEMIKEYNLSEKADVKLYARITK